MYSWLALSALPVSQHEMSCLNTWHSLNMDTNDVTRDVFLVLGLWVLGGRGREMIRQSISQCSNNNNTTMHTLLYVPSRDVLIELCAGLKHILHVCHVADVPVAYVFIKIYDTER